MSKAYRRLFGGAVVVSLVAAGMATAAPAGGRAARTGDTSPTAAPAGGTTTEGRTGQAGSFRAPNPIRVGEPTSVLVFPFGFRGGEEAGGAAPAGGEAPAGGAAAAPAATGGLTTEQAETASYLTAAVKAGFLSTPWYTVATFAPNSSLVQRARKDEILRPEHVTGVISTATGAVDVDKARVITQRLSMQALLVGTLEMNANAKTNTVELTVEAQLLNSTTAEVIGAAAVSGVATGTDGVPMSVLRERAALDAAQKIFPAMHIQLVSVQTSQPIGDSAPSKKAAKSKEKAPKAKPEPKVEKKASSDRKPEKRTAAAGSEGRVTPVAAVAAPEAAAPAPAPAPAAAAAPPASSPAPTAAAAPSGPTYRGEATAAGQPIPYGYAVGDGKNELPRRNRGGLRVPPWLGVAAFLTGLSFLVY